MRMSSRLLSASAALVMGSFVVDAGSAGEYQSAKEFAKAYASGGSKSGGIAVKGVVKSGGGQPPCCSEVQTLSPGGGYGGFFFVGEAALAGQKNWTKASAIGNIPASAHSVAFGGSTAKTENESDDSYGGGGGAGAASSSESPSGGGGSSGTSASSFGGSSSSASVGGGGKK